MSPAGPVRTSGAPRAAGRGRVGPGSGARLAGLLGPWLTLACGEHSGGTCTAPCRPSAWTELALLAGQPGGPGWSDAAGPLAHFSDPWALAWDGAGRLFVADGGTIRVVDTREPATPVTTLAGAFGGTGGDDGVGAAARFVGPSGLAYAAATGILYVADTENSTIRAIDVASATVTTFAGAYGQGGFLDGDRGAARFREPEGLALDASGDLWVGDTDNDVLRRIHLATGEVTTVAGTAGVSGGADGIGTAATFSKPKAVAIDGKGDVLVLDSLNLGVRKVSMPGAAVTTVAILDTLPEGLAPDGDDVLVSLADHRLVRVQPSGTVLPLAGGTGLRGFADGAGADARFSTPAGLVADTHGAIYVADEGNTALRRIGLATGEVTTVAGANPLGSSDGTGAESRFRSPQGLAAGPAGAVFVADTGNDTLRRIDGQSGAVTTIAGAAGQAGRLDGAGPDARFAQPSGLAWDGAETLWVADPGNRAVRRVDLQTGNVETLVPVPAAGGRFTRFGAPNGLALARDRLYVTDYGRHTVVAVELATGAAGVLAGREDVPGPTDGTGDGARFYAPSGVVVDGDALLVSDTLNDVVRRVVIATGAVTTLAGRAGTRGADDGVGPAARFAYPGPLGIAGAGGTGAEVFVGDTLNHTVRRVALARGAVTTVIGDPSLPGVTLGPLPGRLGVPTALALTAEGGLLLASESAILIAR